MPLHTKDDATAADAYARFGKGRHPAALNIGDCFAYACAQAHGAKLLFKGDDFGRTNATVALTGQGLAGWLLLDKEVACRQNQSPCVHGKRILLRIIGDGMVVLH